MTCLRNLSLVILVSFIISGDRAYGQSGHSVMKGYVAFEGVNYVDKQPRAKVELRPIKDGNGGGIVTETTEHGLYEFNPAPLGECLLRISAPGFHTYEIRIYIPSDFLGNIAIMMKRAGVNKSPNKN